MTKIKNKSFCISAIVVLSIFLNSHAFAADKTPAGVVIASDGNVKAVAPDLSERTLSRGASFYSLEKIIVDDDSKVQLKFSDGGLVNLIPSSEYVIDSYSFNIPGQTDESTTSLVKGGFRLLSGSIAKDNPSNVTIKTPVATIGLLGTTIEGNIMDDQLYLSCLEGVVKIKNSHGEILIGGDNSLFASISKSQKPESLSERPEALAVKLFIAPRGAESIKEPQIRKLDETPIFSPTPRVGPSRR